MDYRILNTIGSKYSVEAKEIINQLGSVDYLDLDQEKLEEIISGYNIVVVGLGLNINKKVIDKAVNLKLIATATTGLDHIDTGYAKEKNIAVLSLRGETEFLNTITGTAELAFGLAIDLLRKTPFAFNSVMNNEWNREKFRGHNVYGKTLGIVGLGRLGCWMARYGKAFGMRVIATDPNIDNDIFVKEGCAKVSFDELLAQSDIVSLHVHLSTETEGMFNKDVFSKMRQGSYLINTSRGKIVDQGDLIEVLERGAVAGYATDVLSDELEYDGGLKDQPLVEYAKSHNNVIIVPHIGGMTYESREATDIFIAQKVLDFFR